MCDNGRVPPSLLEISLQARQLELELFWRRALFFGGFIASAFIGFASTYSDNPIVAIMISCFGAICSLCWALVNRGSKYWYEIWEDNVKNCCDDEVKKLFNYSIPPHKKRMWSAKRYSVSKLTIALSDFTVVLWVGILLCQAVPFLSKKFGNWHLSEYAVVVLLLVTATFAMLIVKFGHGTNDKKVSDEKH